MSIAIIATPSPSHPRSSIHLSPSGSLEDERVDDTVTAAVVDPAMGTQKRDHTANQLDMIRLSRRTITVTNVEERAMAPKSSSIDPFTLSSSSPFSSSRQRTTLSGSNSRGTKATATVNGDYASSIVRRASSGSLPGLTRLQSNLGKDSFAATPLKKAKCEEFMSFILGVSSEAATTARQTEGAQGNTTGEGVLQAATGKTLAEKSKCMQEDGDGPVTDQELRGQLYFEPSRHRQQGQVDPFTTTSLFSVASTKGNTDSGHSDAYEPDPTPLPKSVISESSVAMSAKALPTPKETSMATNPAQNMTLTVDSLAIQDSTDHSSAQKTLKVLALEPVHKACHFSLPPSLQQAHLWTQPPNSDSAMIESGAPTPGVEQMGLSQKCLSHRLSYLTHVEQFGAADDDDEDNAENMSEVNVVEATTSTSATVGISQALKDYPLCSSRSAPRCSMDAKYANAQALCTEDGPTLPALSPSKYKSPPISAPSHFPSRPTTRPAHGAHVSSQPALPKLYRRLLRLFKPPSDSSDSGDTLGAAPFSAVANTASSGPHRGPFGFPANPFGENGPFSASRRPSANSTDSTASRAAAASVPTPGSHQRGPSIRAAGVVSPQSPKPQGHRYNEALGFRARLMRKLASSPNFKAEVNPLPTPPAGATALASGGEKEVFAYYAEGASRRGSLGSINRAQESQKTEAAKDAYALRQPMLTSFHHDASCPAGQRMQAKTEVLRRHQQGRPRADTLPRIPVPTPTLQSKYGTPTRELGAGTQAQVMLLRVRSGKRLRDWLNTQPASSISSATVPASLLSGQPKPKSERTPLFRHPSPSTALAAMDSPITLSKMEPDTLKPLEPSGMVTTTTSEYMTPEQREAYRKRLFSKYGSSPSVCSTTSVNSLSHQLQHHHSGDSSKRPIGSAPLQHPPCQQQQFSAELIFAIKRFRAPKAHESHRQYLKKICAEFCISTSMVHENVIRTIDLVRDQPGQDFEEEGCKWADQHYRGSLIRPSAARSAANKSSMHEAENMDDGNYDRNDDEYNGGREREDESEYDDCQCPNFDAFRRQYRYQQAQIKRRSVVGKSRRKTSDDILPIRRPSPSNHSSQNAHRHHRHHQHHRHAHHHHNQQSQHQLQHNGLHSQSYHHVQQKFEEEQCQHEVARLKYEQQHQHNHHLHMFKKRATSQESRKDLFPEYCMVMEFAAGGDLFSLLTKSHSTISLNEKHCLWRQLVNGVHYLHSMGVAHRDLKPENLLIDASGRILKITDFGIANVFKSVGDPTALQCRGILGSEPYIAPEEFYQEEYDPRMVDVWACGIIFYVMYYSAMPWARADRKKDARFARYVNDIFIYRRSEPLRQQQYERYMTAQHVYTITTQRQMLQRAQTSESPVVHQSSSESLTSDGSASSVTDVGGCVTTPNSNNASLPSSSSLADDTSLAYIYNTYAHNQYLGGHEFIDRIDAPGCRRVLYAILEPDVRQRLTIEQVLQDEWVQQIRYCTNDPEKQEQQCLMHQGLTANDLNRIKEEPGGTAAIYMRTLHGRTHHQHAVPKRVKA